MYALFCTSVATFVTSITFGNYMQHYIAVREAGGTSVFSKKKCTVSERQGMCGWDMLYQLRTLCTANFFCKQ